VAPDVLYAFDVRAVAMGTDAAARLLIRWMGPDDRALQAQSSRLIELTSTPKRIAMAAAAPAGAQRVEVRIERLRGTVAIQGAEFYEMR
jgi:hypothetical protein